MDGKPTYEELEARVRDLDGQCALLSAGMDSFFVEAPAGLALFDRELRYVRINKTLAEFAGKSISDHLGRQLHEMIPGVVGLEAEAGLRRVLETGEAALSKEISGEIPTHPGVIRYWLHSQFPVHDSSGEIVGVGVVVVEVSSLKHLLEEVKRKETFQRLLLENLPEKIFMKDADSRYLYCNKNLAQDLGVDCEDVAGKCDFDFFPQDLAEKYRADDKRIMSSQKCEEIEERYLVGGNEYVVHTVKAPVVSDTGETLGLLGIVHDITARKQNEMELAHYQAGLENLVAARTSELQINNDKLQAEIVRRRILEEELGKSERKYREFVEGTRDLITQVDSQGRLLFVNYAAHEIFGLPPEECLGLSAFDFVHPEDRATTKEAFNGWLKNGVDSVILLNRQMSRTGKVHYLSWTCNCYYDSSGKLSYVNSIARDMTELQKVQEELRLVCEEQEDKISQQTRELQEKVVDLIRALASQQQAEGELRESEERFRQIAENINSVFWIRDLPSEQVLYVSPAYETIWGRSCGSLYRAPDAWLESVHPDDRGWVQVKLFSQQYRQQGLEFRIIRADGATRWVRSKSFRVRDHGGKKYREVGVAEDITTYMEILDKLRDSEARYRTLFETSVDGISIYEISKASGKQKVVDCNASYLELSGRRKEELFAAADIKNFKNNHRKIMSCEDENASQCCPCGISCDGLYSWLRPDGQINFVECRGKQVFFNGGEFMHCMHRDMTQVKLAEEHIRHLSRRIIESAEEEQKRIAADLHDEFGEILLSLRQQVDTLRKKSMASTEINSPEVMKIGEIVDVIGGAIRGVINRLRPDLLDHLGFVQAVEWGLRDFSNRNPTITTSLKVTGAQRKILPEYEIALYRIIQEGVTNIGKHAGASTVSVRLVFSYPSLIVTIGDDGRGFDPAYLAGLTPGTHGGIGLRSMHERMQAIGGNFSVRSLPGVGTKIRAEVKWVEEGKKASADSSLNNEAVEWDHE